MINQAWQQKTDLLCPEHLKLCQYAACELDAESSEAITGHLDVCETCRNQVMALFDSGTQPNWSVSEYLRRPRDVDETAAGETWAAIQKGVDDVTPRPLEPGTQIRQFILGPRIGKGGMGAVHEAIDQKTGRKVAIKFMEGVEDSYLGNVRVLHEAQALAKLSHPEIVLIYDVIADAGRPLLVMEYLEGVTLERWRQGLPVQARLAAKIIRQMAMAVDYAHHQGVVHRDLKPSNVMLIGESARVSRTDAEADIRLKVTDFGVAKILDSEAARLTRTGDLVGTIDYMSPEQATGGVAEVGPASDIYSLGAILHTLVAGRPPLIADDPVVALRMIAEMEPLPVRAFAPQVPIDLETICAKCLEKSPERRYCTASDLADDLGAFLEGNPIAARPIGILTRFARQCLRHRAITTAVATVITSLTVLAITGFAVANQRYKNSLELKRLAESAQESAERAQESKEQMRKAWHTGLDRMNDAMSEMQINLFLQGTALENAPEDQRKAFEVWGSLVSEYLQQLGSDEPFGYPEAKYVVVIIILESQLSKELIPPDKLAGLLEKAAEVSDQLLKESPNDEWVKGLKTIITDYSQKRGLGKL